MARTAAPTFVTLRIKHGLRVPDDIDFLPRGGTMHIDWRNPQRPCESDKANCSVCKKAGTEHDWRLCEGASAKVVRCSISEPKTNATPAPRP